MFYIFLFPSLHFIGQKCWRHADLNTRNKNSLVPGKRVCVSLLRKPGEAVSGSGQKWVMSEVSWHLIYVPPAPYPHTVGKFHKPLGYPDSQE